MALILSQCTNLFKSAVTSAFAVSIRYKASQIRKARSGAEQARRWRSADDGAREVRGYRPGPAGELRGFSTGNRKYLTFEATIETTCV